MEIYNHFEYGEKIASSLIPIQHTPEKPRFFTAFGLEDLYNFDDKLSSVTGMILIAVDGCESSSTDNQADHLTDKNSFSFIVARNTISDRPETINQAAKECRVVAKEIRNKLFHYTDFSDYISRDTQINGIGPIGDNFYGVILTFIVDAPEEFFIDRSFWLDNGLL